MNNHEFNSKVGEFIPIEQCNNWREQYAENHQKEQTNFINSYFFGKDSIQHLLDYPEAIGIRIYYALDNTDKKMLIFPVDKDGNDIYIAPFNLEETNEKTLTVDSLDATTQTQIGGLDGGWPCPPYCTTKKPDQL